MVPSSVLMLSTKTTRLARRNSRKSPGVSSAISSRDSSWRWYSSLRCSAHGDRNSDNTRIATKKGAANQRIGRRQSARPTPEENQTIISLSRYQRTSVSRTVMKTVTETRILK